MVFNKATKQAFVFPPKTGTITCLHFLISCGWKRLPNPHQYTAAFVEAYPSLKDYSLYGFFRDPLKRFESSVLFLKQVPTLKLTENYVEKVIAEAGIDKTRESISYEEVIDLFPLLMRRFDRFLAPQSTWLDFPNVTTLDFENLESELKRIAGHHGKAVTRYNASTSFGRSVITDKVRSFVREYYAADYDFAKNVLGKKY
jgi:hypothetical protein